MSKVDITASALVLSLSISGVPEFEQSSAHTASNIVNEMTSKVMLTMNW